MTARCRPPVSRWLIAAVLAAAVFSFASLAAGDEEQDGPPARSKFANRVQFQFQMEDFDQLEQTAKELRDTRARFPEGVWKLPSFYHGLDPKNYVKQENDWKAWFERFEAWKKAHPNSVTVRIAQAEALTSHAWKARGSGWASTVTEAGGNLFEERLGQARAVLEEAQKLPEKCPHGFAVMQTVALGQGWSDADYERLFSRAVAAEPLYHEFHFRKAAYLLPRWHGEEGDWERFADEAVKLASAEGTSIYTRIAWANSGYYSNLFQETRIQWPRMRQGFLDLEKLFPDSTWNLNTFCKFALLAEDRETVATLVSRIGEQPHPQAWDTPGHFERARRFADPQLAEAKPRATLRRQSDSWATTVAFSPDSKSLAAGYQNGAVVVWDVARQQPDWSPNEMEERVASVAFSPDGKLLAVTQGREDASARGLVKIWDAETRKLRKTVDGWKGMVSAVRFSPDGRTLAMAGGIYKKQGEARLLDVASGKVTDLDWPLKHTHHLETVTFSPDGQFLVTDCNRSITVWDLAGKKSAFETKQTLKKWVQTLVFSPDGRTLAAGTAAGWAKRSELAPVVLWDAPGFTERSPGITTKTAGILSVDFSPDGKLLIGGGYDQCVRVWQIATGKEVATYFGHDAMIYEVAFSPDGKTIASASADGTVRLWDAPASVP